MQLLDDTTWYQEYLAALTRLSEKSHETTIRFEHRETTGPRMSGLGSCARQSWYAARGTEPTNPREPSGNWPSMLGHYGQALTTEVLKEMGYTVSGVEDTVTLADGIITGHVDGMLTGFDLGDSVAVFDSKFRGLWALVGTKNSYGWVTDGLPQADVGAYLQIQSYIAATGADCAIIVCHPFDLSGFRTQAAIKKIEPRIAYRMVLMPDAEAQELALTRGKMLNAAVGIDALPAREHDPYKDNFPCINYCDWHAQCVADDFTRPAEIVLPPIPLKYTYTGVTS